MKTTHEHHLITWQRGLLIETHGNEDHYSATGESNNYFKIWSGTWIEIAGEFDRVENIQEEV